MKKPKRAPTGVEARILETLESMAEAQAELARLIGKPTKKTKRTTK